MKNLYVLLFLLAPGLLQAKELGYFDETEEETVIVKNTTEYQLDVAVGVHRDDRPATDAVRLQLQPGDWKSVKFLKKKHTTNIHEVSAAIKGNKERAHDVIFTDKVFFISVDDYARAGINVRSGRASPHRRTPSPSPTPPRTVSPIF